MGTESSRHGPFGLRDCKTALGALDKPLALLRSVQTLEGTDKDSVEHLLEVALENLRTASRSVQ